MIELRRAILTHNVDLVSFDLFETLLLKIDRANFIEFDSCNRHTGRTSTSHTSPSAVSYAIPISSVLAKREVAEVAARRRSNQEEISLAEIYSNFFVSPEVQRNLLDTELHRHRASIVFNPYILKVISGLFQENRAVCFTSDTYLPRDYLVSLLQSKIPSVSEELMLVSSEERYTKGSGRLFRILLSRFSLAPHQVLHIGDHPIADEERPKSLGINTLTVAPSPYSLKVERIQQQSGSSSVDLSRTLFAIGRAARSSVQLDCRSKEEFFFEFGSLNLGPLFEAFSTWALKLALQLGIEKLLCITREGHLFKRIIEYRKSMLISQGFKEFESVSVEIFYCSRQASFFPSICDSTPDAVIDMVLSRVDISLRDVLASLGITTESETIRARADIQSQDFDRYNIGSLSVKEWLYQTLLSNWSRILTRAKDQKRLINKYISNIGGRSKFAFLDLGCNGTIFSQLAQSLDNSPEHYLHLYSSVMAHERMLGIGWLHSFVDSYSDKRGNVNLVARSAEVLETLLNGLAPSTIAYKATNNDEVLPVFDNMMPSNEFEQHELSFSENVERTSLTNDTEQLVFDAIEAGIKAWMGTKESIHEQLSDSSDSFRITLQERHFCFQQFARVISYPTIEEADYIGRLYFGRNFGSMKTRRLVTTENVDDIRADGVIEVLDKLDENFNYKKSSLVWPAGAITQAYPRALSTGRFEGIRGGLSSSIIESLLSKLKPLRGEKVVIYGFGRVYQELKSHLGDLDITVTAIIDRSAKQVREEDSVPKLLDISEYVFKDGEIIIIASTGFVNEMRHNILERSSGLDLKIVSF